MLLPLHPQPKDDEILSSWMVRMAFANRFPLHTFYNKLLGYRGAIWNQDVDRHPHPDLLSLLAKSSGQLPRTLQNMTLGFYEGLFYDHLSLIGNTAWIIPVGLFHRTRKRPGMQFCPQCLKLDSIPYYRRHWRLALYALCEHHRCVLADRCPSCHAPVAYHRHGIGRHKTVPEVESLFYCHHCSFDLRQTPLTFLDWFDEHSLQKLHTTMRYCEQGYWDCGPLTPPCSIPFFQGVKTLMGVLIGRNGTRLIKILSDTCGVEIGKPDGSVHSEPERLSSLERAKLLLVIFWLLDDWPQRFIALCRDAKFTRSRLAERVGELPFWLVDVADQYLDNRIYLPNKNEVMAAGHYLQSRKIDVTVSSLGDVFGLCLGAAYQVWHAWVNLSVSQ